MAFTSFLQKLRKKRTCRVLQPHFDIPYYLSQNPDVAEAGLDPILHYVTAGWAEGRDPAPDFSTRYYVGENPDIRFSETNPFLHYISFGQAEGRLPAPPAPDQQTLSLVAPEFDQNLYRSYFPEGKAPENPLEHYLSIGWREGLDPNGWFSTRYYLSRHPDVAAANVNPFVHYLDRGKSEKRGYAHGGGFGAGARQIYGERSKATAPGPDFEELDTTFAEDKTARAKVFTYYLPQFHAVSENDEFWGTGFTEWRNVSRGQPRFSGHVQPRIPRDLGFYDLDNPEVMRRQIEMAAAAGVFGFCFYYYWFGGKRILEKPVERLLADPSLDFPFTVMWANENWTRTWDGMEKEVLLQQDYSESHDAALVDDLARHFRDPRYFRIGERPLFFIYRPGHIPEVRDAITRWRALFKERHDMEPLFFMAQSFGHIDPNDFGMDGAIEFPPHKICDALPDMSEHLNMFDDKFTGRILSYDDMVKTAGFEPVHDFPLIRTTAPHWDNEARRPGNSLTLHGSTPAKFENWMHQTIDYARRNPVLGEPIVAVNAWNEWAEGAYLEPDLHYGGAYLNALSRAVYGIARPEIDHHRVVIVGHDALRHGAQLLVKHLAQILTARFGIEVVIVLCRGGDMLNEYEALCETHVLGDEPSESRDLLRSLRRRGFAQAVVNTTVSGQLVPMLKDEMFHVTALVHELGKLIRDYNLQSEARKIAEQADRVIFPADTVRASFLEAGGPVRGEVIIRPQGLYQSHLLERPRTEGGVREQLGLPPNARIVLNVGYANLRKGFDRFVGAGMDICGSRDDVWFVWVGEFDPDTHLWIVPDVQTSPYADRFRFVGQVDDMSRWYAAADVFFLSSREDPFPSVVMEAMAAQVPVVGIAGTGGCDDLIRDHGTLLENGTCAAVAEALLDQIDSPGTRKKERAQAARADIRENYLFDSYCHDLISSPVAALERVSVIVPNYNYAACLEDRLLSIFRQSYPVFEVIVLDDASSDDSVEVIQRVAKAQGRHIDLVVNDENSGSPFVQWRAGLERARGDFVWIAEADDIAAPEFLQNMVERMARSNAGLGFCDSWQIDENSRRIGESYKPYLSDPGGTAFENSFDMEGQEFLARFLAVKNVILNVSGVVFRKPVLQAAMQSAGDRLDDMSVAGDWLLYAEICAASNRIAYDAAALNGHRRHRASVTHALKAERHISEIEEMQSHINALVLPEQDIREAQSRHLSEARATLKQQGE